jgi:sulfur carrier protein ThiS
MVMVKLLGNAKKVMKSDILRLDYTNIDNIIGMLKSKGIDTNELLILVNGVESSLITDKRLNNDDIVTIASIVHGG